MTSEDHEIPLATRYFMKEMTQEEFEKLAKKHRIKPNKDYKFHLINKELKDEQPNS